MDIVSLWIKNFLAIGDAGIRLRLDNRGLNLIQGENGAGKSTCVDALSWVFYNVTARDESGDAIVNNKSRKNCEVAVELDDDGDYYRVTRYRKHKVHKNMLRVEKRNGASWDDLTLATDKDTQTLVEKILGCSRGVFVAAIYAGQEAMPDLPCKTDRELKAIIEEAAGCDRLEAAYQCARARLDDVKTDMNTLLTVLKASSEALEADKKSLKEANEKAQAFESSRADRKAEAIRQAATKKTELVTLGKQYNDIGVESLIEKAKACHAEISSAKPALEASEAANQTLHEAKRAYALVESQFKSAYADAERVRRAIENAPDEMKKPCPECGKPHTAEELSDFVAHTKKRLAEKVNAARAVKAKMDIAQTRVAEAQKAADSAKAAIPDVSDASARYSKINDTLRKASEMKLRLGVMLSEYKAKMESAERFMTEANPFTSAIKLLEQRIEERNGKISSGNATRKLLEDKLAIAESVVKVFSPAGVRAHILDTVTPFLNERTDDYLSILSDGEIRAVWSTLGTTAKGELREKFNIAVTHENGGQSFKLISGGEKKKTRLATMMALQDLQASRAVKPINLFIADEIDDAISTSGHERLMVILERRARERGTVIVISHNDLADWATQVTTMTKTQSGSIAEGALVE